MNAKFFLALWVCITVYFIAIVVTLNLQTDKLNKIQDHLNKVHPITETLKNEK